VPTLTVIAGPNGAGKSTVTRLVPIEGLDRLLDPDAIAREMSPADPSAAAIAAGREVLNRQKDYLRNGQSFVVETTLAGSRGNLLGEAKRCGYTVHLLYVGLDTPELCLSRVRNRVLRGGHSVPEDDIRRRYARSMANAADLTFTADLAKLYDNSDNNHRLVLIAKCGVITYRADPLPPWLASWPNLK
jgi:predicted ABC-type ATPase